MYFIVFNKKNIVFEVSNLLKSYKCEVIPIPIDIEIKYFNGIAPCGYCLKVPDDNLYTIVKQLEFHEINIDYLINEEY